MKATLQNKNTTDLRHPSIPILHPAPLAPFVQVEKLQKSALPSDIQQLKDRGGTRPKSQLL